MFNRFIKCSHIRTNLVFLKKNPVLNFFSPFPLKAISRREKTINLHHKILIEVYRR